MILREFGELDLSRVTEMHKASGLKYSLPPMSTFFSRRVIESDNEVQMVSLLKLTAEAYLICDPSWRNPAWRMEALRQLDAVANHDAKQWGVVEAVSFIPPQIEKTFRLRLERMGWSRNKPSWHSYWKAVI